MTPSDYVQLRDLIDGLGKEMRQSFKDATEGREEVRLILSKALFVGGNGGGPHGIYWRLDELERRSEEGYVHDAEDRQRNEDAKKDVRKVMITLGIEIIKSTFALAVAIAAGRGIGWL